MYTLDNHIYTDGDELLLNVFAGTGYGNSMLISSPGNDYAQEMLIPGQDVHAEIQNENYSDSYSLQVQYPIVFSINDIGTEITCFIQDESQSKKCFSIEQALDNQDTYYLNVFSNYEPTKCYQMTKVRYHYYWTQL